MAIIRLNWQPPTTRESGRALKPSDIAGFSLEHSLDGAAFEKLVDSPAGTTQRDFENAGPGVHKFRLACFDTRNKSSQAFEGSIEVEDDTPPSMVLNLTLSVVNLIQTSQG